MKFFKNRDASRKKDTHSDLDEIRLLLIIFGPVILTSALLSIFFQIKERLHTLREPSTSITAKAENLENIMGNARKLAPSINIASSNLEIENDLQQPISTYVVSLAQDTSDKTYLFKSEEYILDIGSGAETGNLCKKVKDASPKEVKSWIDEAQLNLGVEYPPLEGGVQIPIGPFLRDLARVFGLVAREHSNFSSLSIFIKGFADGNVGNWERKLEPYPYSFHQIIMLPQLDDKNSVTPYRFMAAPTNFSIGNTYRNEHLANLRAAFVEHDVVRPMLDTCLKDDSVSIRILEGYVSHRTIQDPMKRKVEIYLRFYS